MLRFNPKGSSRGVSSLLLLVLSKSVTFLLLFYKRMNNNKYIIILKLINYLNLLLKLQDIQLKAFIFQIKFNEPFKKISFEHILDALCPS